MNSFDYCGAPQLPFPSAAVRNVPMASAGHCTTNIVLGDGPGVRMQGESMLEMRHQLILNGRRDVASIQEQVRFFYGWNPKKPDEHVFDMVVTMRDGQVIAYAVKPEIRLKSGRFLKEMQEVAWWVRHKGFADDVRILTDADINRVTLHNAQMFAVMRNSPDPDAMAAARRVVSRIPVGGGVTLRALTIETGLEARGYRALLRLLREGVLEPLKPEAITPTTLVRRASDRPDPGLVAANDPFSPEGQGPGTVAYCAA